MCVFNSSEEKVSLDEAEFEVPAEPQVGVFKRKWETDLELLREELRLEIKIGSCNQVDVFMGKYEVNKALAEHKIQGLREERYQEKGQK